MVPEWQHQGFYDINQASIPHVEEAVYPNMIPELPTVVSQNDGDIIDKPKCKIVTSTKRKSEDEETWLVPNKCIKPLISNKVDDEIVLNSNTYEILSNDTDID